MYGSNSHSDYDGDKTNLTGVVATALYRFGDPTRPGLYVFGNLGMLRHAYSSEMFPDEEGSESGVAFGAGAGVSIPRGRLSLHAQAGFLTASMDGSSTAFIPIMVGVSIPLGSR